MPTRIDAPLRLLKYPLQMAKGQQRRRQSFILGSFQAFKRLKKGRLSREGPLDLVRECATHLAISHSPAGPDPIR